METLVLNPTSTAQWHSLVAEAEDKAHISLHEDLESYLIFLLMRYTENTHIASSVVALEFLESLQQTRKESQNGLQNVGDSCLLFSGLFPERARRKRVKIAYYVNLGQGAYSQLSTLAEADVSRLFTYLSKEFVSLMDVMFAMRELNTTIPSLDPLQAEELFSDTGSRYAQQTLEKIAAGTPYLLKDNDSDLRH